MSAISPKLFACLVVALYSAVNVQLATAQTIYTTSSNGYRIAITHPSLEALEPGHADLAFYFRVEKSDGSKLPPNTPLPEVSVTGWTAQNIDPGCSHAATLDETRSGNPFSAHLSGLDLRCKTAHLIFSLRDPGNTTAPPTRIVSHVVFDGIPPPRALNVPVPVNQSCTTPFGTIVTLKRISTTTDPNWGRTYSRFDFAIDHSKVPDDEVWLSRIAFYNAGVPIVKTSSPSGNISCPPGERWMIQQALMPGLTGPLKFDFAIQETAASLSRAVGWFPLEAEIPLARLETPKVVKEIAGQCGVEYNGNDFRLQLVRSTTYKDLWYTFFHTKSANRGITWFINDMEWMGPGARRGYSHGFARGNELSLNADGSVIGPDESNALFVWSSAATTPWPIKVKIYPSHRIQETLTFSNIKVIGRGQDVKVNQHPDKPSRFNVRLVRVITPVSSSIDDQSADRILRFIPNGTMGLVFETTDADKSYIGMAEEWARDTTGYAVNKHRMKFCEGYASPTNPRVKEFVVTTEIPAQGSKSINLKAVIVKDEKAGDPVWFLVNQDGSWRVTTPEPPDGQAWKE
ncbi:MAG TPA: hypothetical protein VGK19_08445 [Capsulimonadaceae bacterium]|jgi:hypothetical protein